MTGVYEIADRFVDELARIDPIAATFIGIPGHDDQLTDYTLDGLERLAELERSTRSAVTDSKPGSDRERLCRDTVIDEMGVALEIHDAGEHFRGLNVMHSPLQSVRMVFDMMPRSTDEQWSNIARRMNRVSDALTGYRQTLAEGVRRGAVASRRQVLGCAEQCESWTGANGNKPFFVRLAESYEGKNSAVRADLVSAAAVASSAYADFGKFLGGEYASNAEPADGVGAGRYALHARSYNGVRLDLEDTYRWGWEQVRWVRSEMQKTAGRIKDSAPVSEVIELLDTDPARSIEGEEPFCRWMQDLQERTISELDGAHFDVAAPVRRIETLIAPPGGALAMYYTGPSEDFTRPGRTWYPTGGKTRFPIWREVSIAYHEGVPGHHFQIATNMTLAGELSRYQRLIAGTSGYVEGWALYAERLMGELGYLDNPDFYLGMLDAQALRSVRVVIDIGMHLGLKIPTDSDFHPGEKWTPDLALEFMKSQVHFPADFVASEVDRYLGIPGQAISYKVGERVWLEAREASKQRAGGSFKLKDWHNRALRLGPMGLAQMKREMATV